MGSNNQKPATRSLEDEQEYVVDFEVINLSKIIANIQNENPYAESPVYTEIIIPEISNIIKKLKMINSKIDTSINNNSDITIADIVKELN